MRTPALPAHPLPIQGALPAAPCTLQPPEVSVGEGEPFLFPMGRDGAAGVRGIPTSASAQPWGTSLTLKHHPIWSMTLPFLTGPAAIPHAHKQNMFTLKTANQP